MFTDSKFYETGITNVLNSNIFEMNGNQVICWYETNVKGTDKCFGYSLNGTSDIKLFQIVADTQNKNNSRELLKSVDFDNEGLLFTLIEEAMGIVVEEPMDITDLQKQIMIFGEDFTITYQSEGVLIGDKSLHDQYSERVIRRNTL